LNTRRAVAGQQQPGVVVEPVQDLGVGAVSQCPVGDVGLPALVGLVGGEADVAALGSLVRLGDDEPAGAVRIRQIVLTAGAALPDRSRCVRMVSARPRDRAGRGLADPDDLVLDLTRGLPRAAMRSS